MSLSKKEHEQLKSCIEGIAAIDPSLPWPEVAQKVLDVFAGVPYVVWETYDNQYWSRPNFGLARKVRNSPEWGEKLFAGFKR